MDISPVSAELDDMVGDIIAWFLDELAEGNTPGVLACIQDTTGQEEAEIFSDDGVEVCLEAARAFVMQHAHPPHNGDAAAAERYAIAHVGYVELESEVQDAILASFYEKGMEQAFSAYVCFAGAGQGDQFVWQDPQPAGADEPLI